ncbi:alpha/beta fold hydrolase [Burkholderia pseudomultivorans]|uniref:2-hydroxy-6-oxononadienedioate/2-hydroxy-6-oxononatrienedioate hydrolase n=1 Tax=Burkholderia pseudomultivorans TaxID=1207504 RepID=A0A132EN08_9BURK|nr:alpha/beta fold hydrolase [Burkholderia pseudomultivorans]KWF37916.1 3-oxoacyl-ACP reductase [Burkholderia pseudomultivorans]MDR8726286.1 2-hydroxy-6-oxononadienedioate/2-hydroxy-6-oxononatrienedioate hydrolase [Burkholderia pseudomultivorans]MDR8733510.1 2-hydroxy-6-oxononadienedioate/2-hydroxy-6-oxononatrienedioate hydrolase [Burkholderia pseudomultivorans]MDR8740036.1 2-hydroxy-6-oxononadienedioate/2-hydroxy-6-oxononatrienedioate hydrolase [Burkholderia pseudomultivorans]MDR8756201.1 2-h
MTTPTTPPDGIFTDVPGGLRLHHFEAGAGRPVVFIHGSGPGASGFSNFKHNYPAFAAAGHRAIVVDLPGYGQSSKPSDVAYTLDFFVGALHAQLTALGVGPAVLLGNSLGGAVALKYALDHPDAVDALIMMAPGGVEDRDTYFRMEGIQRMVKLFTHREMNDDTMRELLTLLVHDPAIVTDALVAERMKVCVEQPTEVLSTMSVPNLTDALGELRCPVLGFWGTDDRFNPVGGAMKFVERCRDARVVLMNRCGHWVMVEHAAYFNRECLDFLATQNAR